MKTLLYSIMLLVINTSLYSQTDDSTSFLKGVFSKRPVYCDAEYSNVVGKGIGISEVNFGFDGELKSGEHSGFEYHYDKSRFRVQYLNIGLGYKKYNDNQEQSFPFLTGHLYKITSYSTLGGGFTLNFNGSVFDKKANYFINSEIDWLSLGIGFGYDFFSGNEDIRFTPIAHLNLGYYTFTPDTLVLTDLPKETNKTLFGWYNAGIKLFSMYKSFDLMTEYSGKGSKDVSINGFGVELSYILWKENTETDLYGRNQKYYQNNFKVFIRFDSKVFNVVDANYHYTIQVIRMGITGRIGKIM